jgi:hypothetical protein
MGDPRYVTRDGEAREVPTDAIGVHRRRLLETAAGGFALAASGLLLPVQLLEEAEARTKPLRRVQDRTEQRHRKRHHRNRHHHRHRHHHGNTSDSDRPPTGSIGLLNVALSIHNLRGTVVAGRVWIAQAGEIIYWTPKGDWRTIAGNRTDFKEDTRRFTVEINTGHIIEVLNPIIFFPRITIGTGGWNTNGWNPRGTTLIDTGLAEGETAKAPGFEVQRLTDTATHKRFLVYLV